MVNTVAISAGFGSQEIVPLPNGPVVVYCASGMRSFDVRFLLIQNGFKDVANLNGGIRAWDGEKARR